MTFSVQSDAGDVVDANAYIAVQFFKDYHADRGVDISDFDDTMIMQGIVRSTDYMDNRFKIKGEKFAGDTQTTEFPRKCTSFTGVPIKAKKACAEYAFRTMTDTGLVSLAPDPTTDESGLVVQSKTEKLGPIEETVSFINTAVHPFKPYPLADKLMAEFVMSGRSVIR